MPAVDDGEQYEYGDVETYAIDGDTSDFSPHQFIAPHETRDAMNSDDNEQDSANNEAARSEILSAEVFDSEDVPSPDNFIQKKAHGSKRSKHMPRDDHGEQYEYGDVETHAIVADTSDFSPHQFIALDEARDPMGSDNNEQDAANNDTARSKILSAEVFDSEDVPSPDNFIQKRVHRSKRFKHMPALDDGEQYEYEYGDVETHAIDVDTSDFSPHQFFAPDDAARSNILSAEVFDSEDVPSPDNFLQIHKFAHHSKHMSAENDGEQYEYGDVETHASDADTSDFSPHRFSEARDAMGCEENEQDAANNDAARSKMLSAEVFDSEDVQSPDNFLQIQKVAHHSKHKPAVDDGEQYEYGDVEAHAIDADTSDSSPHHFIAPDEGSDAMGSDDDDSDTDEDMPSLEALDLQNDNGYSTTDSEYEELEAYLHERGLLDD